jgi:hypothetical protein
MIMQVQGQSLPFQMTRLSEPDSLVPALYYHIQNSNLVAQGLTTELKLSRIDKPELIDRRTTQLARLHILGNEKWMEMHHKVASLPFETIIFNDGSEKETIPLSAIKIKALTDLEYDAMKATAIKELTGSHQSEENEEKSGQTGIFNRAFASQTFINTLKNYFQKQQEIVSFFRQCREQEQFLTAEDTRKRRTKERDQRWNLRMDYWLIKDANRWEILQTSTKRQAA